MPTEKQKNDSELWSLILIIGLIFTLPLIIIDVTYKNIASMFHGADWALGIIWAILHVLIIVGWYIAIKYVDDPNKNIIRVFLIVMHILAIGLTLGHRAGWLERNQVIIDSHQNGIK